MHNNNKHYDKYIMMGDIFFFLFYTFQGNQSKEENQQIKYKKKYKFKYLFFFTYVNKKMLNIIHFFYFILYLNKNITTNQAELRLDNTNKTNELMLQELDKCKDVFIISILISEQEINREFLQHRRIWKKHKPSAVK